MPFYTYRKKTGLPGDSENIIEIFQKMDDPVLQFCPETGEEIEKIITAPPSLRFKGMKRSLSINKKSPASTPCKCIKNSRHHHHHH